jgi:hypothetical protein
MAGKGVGVAGVVGGVVNRFDMREADAPNQDDTENGGHEGAGQRFCAGAGLGAEGGGGHVIGLHVGSPWCSPRHGM